MKIANIALIGILALGTATSALAEDGYGRSLEAVKKFRENQEKIHGKDNKAVQLESQKSGATEKDAAKGNKATNEG